MQEKEKTVTVSPCADSTSPLLSSYCSWDADDVLLVPQLLFREISLYSDTSLSHVKFSRRFLTPRLVAFYHYLNCWSYHHSPFLPFTRLSSFVSILNFSLIECFGLTMYLPPNARYTYIIYSCQDKQTEDRV